VVEKAAEKPIETIKDDGSKRTVMTTLAPWGKVCLQDSKWEVNKSLFSPLRPFRGRQNWKNRLSLLKYEIPVTEPVLYLEVKKGPFVTHTYLVARWIDGVNLARTAIESHRLSESPVRELLKRAADLVAGLHGVGFVHGDLKWSNFLWVDSKPPEIFLSDLDHLEKSSAADKQGKDLARFVLSALEFRMAPDIADSIVEWYFDSRSVIPVGFEKALNKHVERKKAKYIKRGTRRATFQDRT
jgi:3-deoxy-D-manno-octulosonic acid kinase